MNRVLALAGALLGCREAWREYRAAQPTLAPFPHSLFVLFYQVEIRHRQLLPMTIPHPLRVPMLVEV